MKRIYLNGLLIAAAVLTISSAACADLTETVTTRFSGTNIEGKADGPSLSTSTIYKSGDKVKTVTLSPGLTAIGVMDFGSSVGTVWFPLTKTKVLVPDHSLVAVSIPSAKVMDTKRTKMILGHEAHLFRFSLSGPTFTRTGYAWIAADIPAPPQSESFVSIIVDAVSLSHQFPEMRGTWLKASVTTVSPGMKTKISNFYEVTALSNAPIPASAFDIPQDYTTTDYTKTLPAGVPD